MRSVVFFFFGGSPPPPPLPACAEHPCDERDEGGMPSGVAGGLAGGAAVSFVPPRCRSHSHPRRPAPRLPRSERTASQPPGSAAPPGSPPEPWVEKKTERVVVVLVRIVRPEHLLLFYTDEGGTAGGTVHKSLAGVVGSRIRIATEPVTMSDNELAPIVFQYDAMTEESLARFTTGARVISSGRDDAQLAANGGDWDAVITAPYVMYYACGTSGKESSFSGAIGISQSFDLLDWGAVRRPGHQACGQSHSIASSSTSFAHTTVGRRAKTRWPTVVRITQDELDVLEYEFPTTLERAETVVGIIMTSLALIGVFAFLAALCFVRLLGGRCGCGSSGSLASMRALAFLTDVSIVM